MAVARSESLSPLLPRKEKQMAREMDKHVDGFRVEIAEDFVGASQRRSVSLWLQDALLLCLDHVQLFGLLLSLSLTWPWPLEWIRGASFLLAFNLDAWELAKIHTVYQGQTHAYEDPNRVPFSYLPWAVTWLLAAVALPIMLFIARLCLPRAQFLSPVTGMLLQAKMVRWFLLIVRIFTVPFGLVVVRLFSCKNYTTDNVGGQLFRSTVLRDTQCWSASHLLILMPLLLAFLAYLFVVPAWMIYRIRKELISPVICTYQTWKSHEQHLRLTEAEYLQGLDTAWAIRHHYIFSSYRRPWVWFLPLSILAKGLLILLYGTLFYAMEYQTAVLLAAVGVCLLATIILPVYRVFSFNLMLVVSIFVNLCNLLIGMLVKQGVNNAVLIGQNLINALLVLNVLWLSLAVLWGIYLAARSTRWCARRLGPLWPLLSELDVTSEEHSEHTQRFFKQILRARKVLERCYSSTAYFAPVHELSTQIQIVNAFYREAEVLDDPAHQSLWAVLDEMIDTHREMAPHSIYGTSLIGDIQPGVIALMKLMPAFRKRLDERELELILWMPQKKRILLKLLAISAFSNRGNTAVTIEEVMKQPTSVNGSVSTLALMHDDSEEKNDDYLRELDTWEKARIASMQRLGGSAASIGRLQGSAVRLKSTSSQGDEDVFLPAEEDERDVISILQQQQQQQRPVRAARLNSSRIRITLDTISETEALIQSVDEQYN